MKKVQGVPRQKRAQTKTRKKKAIRGLRREEGLYVTTGHEDAGIQLRTKHRPSTARDDDDLDIEDVDLDEDDDLDIGHGGEEIRTRYEGNQIQT
jgi:hypothetical protein